MSAPLALDLPSAARARLVAMVAERFEPEPNTGCWLWLGALNHEGYGKLWISDTGNRIGAHRASYMAHVGNIPAGLQLDHKCRQRSCVNPAHLEPVTARENTMRGQTITAAAAAKTHCDRGHELAGDNLRVYVGDGHRRCKTCTALKSREHYERNREKIIARTRARELRLASEGAAP